MSASGFRADFFWYALSARDLDNQPRLLQGNDDAQVIAGVTAEWESFLLNLLDECWPSATQRMFSAGRQS